MSQEIRIAFNATAQQGEFATMRAAWLEAEELGVDALYTSDHLHAIVADEEFMTNTNDGTHSSGSGLNVFEGTTIEAAMAESTSRAQIGCIVTCNAYRNPNLTAYIAGTIDHISGGRYVLGLGTGFFKPDFDEYGYEYGTQKERSEKLARDIPVIFDRLEKLTPPPVHRIPLMIASMGEKIGMPLVAKYADIWHVYGPMAKIRSKIESMKRICDEQGRDFAELAVATYYMPEMFNGPDDTLDNYLAAGCTEIITIGMGPTWDLGSTRDALAWRDALVRA